MRKLSFLLPAILVLSACTTVWNKPGGTQEEFNRTNYECERDMRQSGYYGTGLVGSLSMIAFREQCMEAHGYTKVDQ